MLLSEIISKPIISLTEGKIKGVLSNALFSNYITKIICFELISEESEEENYLEKESIKCIGDDAIILKPNFSFTDAPATFFQNPINGLAYSTTGSLLGKIINIEVDDKYNVLSFITTNNTLNAQTLVSFSNGLYIFNLEDKKVKKFTNKFIFPTLEKNVVVSSLPLLVEKEVVPPPPLPIKSTTNSELLLGKRVTKTIQTQNGEIIARKGVIISQKILISATRNQKLRELAFYSE